MFIHISKMHTPPHIYVNLYLHMFIYTHILHMHIHINVYIYIYIWTYVGYLICANKTNVHPATLNLPDYLFIGKDHIWRQKCVPWKIHSAFLTLVCFLSDRNTHIHPIFSLTGTRIRILSLAHRNISYIYIYIYIVHSWHLNTFSRTGTHMTRSSVRHK